MTDIQIVRELSRLYKVRVYFYSKGNNKAGFHKYIKKEGVFHESIHILQNEDILTTFFHELGHSYCTHTGKFPYYHHTKGGRYINGGFQRNIKGLRETIKTCYRAECYVDGWAKKEMAIWLPDKVYNAGYVGNPDAKNWLNNFHLPYFRERLNHKNEKIQNNS